LDREPGDSLAGGSSPGDNTQSVGVPGWDYSSRTSGAQANTANRCLRSSPSKAVRRCATEWSLRSISDRNGTSSMVPDRSSYSLCFDTVFKSRKNKTSGRIENHTSLMKRSGPGVMQEVMPNTVPMAIKALRLCNFQAS
jgi:hypothetical protein